MKIVLTKERADKCYKYVKEIMRNLSQEDSAIFSYRFNYISMFLVDATNKLPHKQK